LPDGWCRLPGSAQRDAESLKEEPSDGAVIQALVDRENARIERCSNI
jgi:hypothetical protein